MNDICNGCPICAAALDEVCGAGSEGFQPNCANDSTCFTRCGKLRKDYIQKSYSKTLYNLWDPDDLFSMLFQIHA